LNRQAFRDCVDKARHISDVDAAVAEGRRLGVAGTPTVFINGRRLVGSLAFETYVAAIQKELEGTNPAELQ
jgi:protein-disulfide isomerase